LLPLEVLAIRPEPASGAAQRRGEREEKLAALDARTAQLGGPEVRVQDEIRKAEKALGSAVRDLREREGLTQADVVERTNTFFDAWQVNNVEQAEESPEFMRLDLIVRLVIEGVGASVSELLRAMQQSFDEGAALNGKRSSSMEGGGQLSKAPGRLNPWCWMGRTMTTDEGNDDLVSEGEQ
jgi:transcriptional regulator with XRE-family HTH domain